MRRFSLSSPCWALALLFIALPAKSDQFSFLAFGPTATATVTGGNLTAFNLEITSIRDVTTGYTQTVTDYLLLTSYSGNVATFELNGKLGTAAGQGITTTTTDLFSFSAKVTITGSAGNYTALFGAPTSLISYNSAIGGFPSTPSTLTFTNGTPTIKTTGTGSAGSITSESNFGSTSVGGLAFTTPEPASFALLGSGLIAVFLLASARRRRLARASV